MSVERLGLRREYIKTQGCVAVTLGLGGLLLFHEPGTMEGRVVESGMFAVSAAVSYLEMAKLFTTALKKEKAKPPPSLKQQLSVLKTDPTPVLEALLPGTGNYRGLLGQWPGGGCTEPNLKTTEELAGRVKAIAISVKQILDPEEQVKSNSDIRRQQVLGVLKDIFGRPTTSQQGLSLLPQERQILLDIVQLGAMREAGPAVLRDYIEVLTLIVRAYCQNLKEALPARTITDQLLTDAIRAERFEKRLVNVPAGLSNQAQALQRKEQERILVTLNEARTAAQSLVAISFRKIPEPRQAAKTAINNLSSELSEFKPKQVGPIIAVLNLSSQYADLDPLRLISTRERTEKPVFEGEVIRIAVSGRSELDKLACAVALLCPHFACIEVCLGEHIVRIPLGEFYQNRLIEGNRLYLTDLFDQQRIYLEASCKMFETQAQYK